MRSCLRMCQSIGLSLIGVFCLLSPAFSASLSPIHDARTSAGQSSRPLAFTKNMGQWPDSILFRADGGGATMWFTKNGIYYQYFRKIESSDPASKSGNVDFPDELQREPDSVETMMIKAEFVGANPEVEVSELNRLEYNCNYFLGNDPSGWRTDVANYSGIKMKNIYRGVDVVYQNQDGEFTFIVEPESEDRLSQVHVIYKDASQAEIGNDESPEIQTKFGEMSCSGILISNGSRRIINESSRQAESSTNVSLVYSTYLGGADNDEGRGIVVDTSENAYVAGTTLSADFPTSGPYQADPADSYDAFVTKFNSTGSNLVYSTFIGGGASDIAYNIDIDSSGNAYITGQTSSSDYPTENPYQTDQGSSDFFVTKLNSSGNSLIFSTYLGGSSTEQFPFIAVDASGNAYVTGQTSSTNFPTLNPYQTDQGSVDAFVTKFSSSGSLIYSTLSWWSIY